MGQRVAIIGAGAVRGYAGAHKARCGGTAPGREFARTCEPVDKGDDERVAGVEEVEQEPQLAPALAARAAPLLRADDVAAGGAQRLLLEGEVLVGGGHAGVAVEGHRGLFVSFGSRPAPDIALERAKQP